MSEATVHVTVQVAKLLAGAAIMLDEEYLRAVALESDVETRLAWVTAVNTILDARDAVKGLVAKTRN